MTSMANFPNTLIFEINGRRLWKPKINYKGRPNESGTTVGLKNGLMVLI